MTKFLFVSKEGAIPDLALTVKNEGHQVRMCILDHAEQEVGNGFVDKVEDWRSHIDWADIIVFDYAEFGGIYTSYGCAGSWLSVAQNTRTDSKWIASSRKAR
jgi:phosphoribosylamine--glycine ligase